MRHRLEALPLIADSHFSVAAKDVSNAGILCTAAIMMGNSGKGAVIDLGAIPKPDSLSLEQWVPCFQSFGFILSVPEDNVARVKEIFSERGIVAGVIGQVHEDPVVALSHEGALAPLFDFNQDTITGIRCP